MLYVPASNARALDKAATLPVDGLILDLEDAVAPDAKPAAREDACAALASGRYGSREVAVRVNAVDTTWHRDDLAAVCRAGPDAVVVPKVESADSVAALADRMDRYGAPADTKLWVMVETPLAVLRAADLAGADHRVAVLVMGTNDLCAALGAEAGAAREPLLTVLGLALLGARVAGKGILDGVFNDITDTAGFRAECRQGHRLGFDGKTLIHPSQVAVANEEFAPSAEAVAQAHGVLRAWEDGRGSGVVTYRGRMVEHLHVEAARRTLALHEGRVERTSDAARPDARDGSS